MRIVTKYVIRHRDYGYLADACAGGAYSLDLVDAVWFDSEAAAWASVDAADIPRTNLTAEQEFTWR